MPGMMDTVLNLGLNDVTVEGLAKRSGNPRFAGTPTGASSPCLAMLYSAFTTHDSHAWWTKSDKDEKNQNSASRNFNNWWAN